MDDILRKQGLIRNDINTSVERGMTAPQPVSTIQAAAGDNLPDFKGAYNWALNQLKGGSGPIDRALGVLDSAGRGLGFSAQSRQTDAMTPLLTQQQSLANQGTGLSLRQGMRLDPAQKRFADYMSETPATEIGKYLYSKNLLEDPDKGLKDGGIIERIGNMLGVRRTPPPQPPQPPQMQTDKANQVANMLGGLSGQAADTIRSRDRRIEEELRRQGFRKGKTKVVDKTGKGSPRKDTVLAKLAEGEAVLNAGAAELLGRDEIEALNQRGLRKMGVPGKPGAVVKGGTLHAAKGMVNIGSVEQQLAENEYAKRVMAQRAINAQRAMREAQMLPSPNNVPYQDNVRMPKAPPNFRTGAPAASMPAVYRDDPLKTKEANLREQAAKINEHYRSQAAANSAEAAKRVKAANDIYQRTRPMSNLEQGIESIKNLRNVKVPDAPVMAQRAAKMIFNPYTAAALSPLWAMSGGRERAEEGSGIRNSSIMGSTRGAFMAAGNRARDYADKGDYLRAFAMLPQGAFDTISGLYDDVLVKPFAHIGSWMTGGSGTNASSSRSSSNEAAPMTPGDAKLLARKTDAAVDGKQVPVPAGYKSPEDRELAARRAAYADQQKELGLRGALLLGSVGTFGGSPQAGLALKNLLDKDASEATAGATAVSKALLARQKAMDDLDNIGKGKFFTTHPKTGVKTENGEMGDQYATVFRRLMEKRGIDPEVAMNDQATRNSLEKEAKLQLLLGQYTSENSGSNLKTGVRDQVGKIKNMSFWGGGDGKYSRWDAMFDDGGIKLEDDSVVPIEWLLKNGAERQTIDRLLAGLEEEE